MPSRKIYCPGCGVEMSLPDQQQTVQCKKCKISISLPREWFMTQKERKSIPASEMKPTFKIAEAPGPPGPQQPQEGPRPPPATVAEARSSPPRSQVMISNEELEPNICSACGGEMMSSVPFQCSVCGSKFCIRCPGRHIPPGERMITAHVKYKYRMRGASQWRNEHIKFSHNLPLVLCPVCYEFEFQKGVQNLDIQIRSWYEGLVQDEDARIVERTMPQMCPSIPDTKNK